MEYKSVNSFMIVDKEKENKRVDLIRHVQLYAKQKQV